MTRLQAVRPLALCLVLAFLAPAAAPLAAETGRDGEAAPLTVDSWLVLGPVSAPLPAFHDAEDHGVKPADLLGSAGVAGRAPWPAPGDEVPLPEGGTARWEARTAQDGLLALDTGDGGEDAPPRLVWLAVRLDVDRLVKPELSVRSAHPLRVLLDGEQVAEKGADAKQEDGEDGEETGEGEGEDDGEGGEEDDAPGAATATLTLEPGAHLLMVRTAFDPGLGDRAWTVGAELTTGKGNEDGEAQGRGEAGPGVTLATDPGHALTISDLLDVPAVQQAEISADGELVALTLARPAVPAEDRESWVEIRRADDGSLVRSFRGGGGSRNGFAWSPEGSHRYLFTTAEGEKTSLWIGDLSASSAVRLLEGMEHFGGARWSPDGSFLVFTTFEVEEPDESGFKRLRALQDRWPQWRNRGSLYQVAVPESLASFSVADPVVRRLTAGDKTAGLADVAPDGSRLLFARSEMVDERPFVEAELFELDLATLEARSLRRIPWFGGASYAPDGRRVLILAGPSAFGEMGEAVPEGTIPNDYDTQAYLDDLETDELEALTVELDPSVTGAAWSPDGGSIYLQVIDRSFGRILRFDPETREVERIEVGVDAVEGMDLARDGSRLVFQGSSADAPPRVGTVALTPNGGSGAGAQAPVTVYEPGAERYEPVRLGRVEDFEFTASSGTSIQGRVHYPPGFDPDEAEEKSTPAIVYYYGGTFPVERSFGGRYPFNLWAAHGYVVYVLQPSGAVGFGQELSARHVNDWGRIVADEIVEGTEAFLEAHPFVDPERVGCGGASYGGFTTMYLLTQTDRFRAAFAHAGISSIASYWGEGWWGFLYSAVASAESYPWNRPDLYVEQSPLYRADEITTPLLLLHGEADTNVPVGESAQLFTALKLLDREVEMVTIEGSNHQIFHYPKRVRWMKTIIAWFDRELKDQPGWWEHLYPEEGGP